MRGQQGRQRAAGRAWHLSLDKSLIRLHLMNHANEISDGELLVLVLGDGTQVRECCEAWLNERRLTGNRDAD